MSTFHLNKLKLEMNVLDPANIGQFTTGGSTTPSTTYLTSIDGWTISGGQIRQLAATWGINSNVYQLRADGTGVLGAFSYTYSITGGNWVGAAVTLSGQSSATYGRFAIQWFNGASLISTVAVPYQLLTANVQVRRTGKFQAPSGANGMKIIPQMSNAAGGSPSSGQGMSFDAVVVVQNKDTTMVDTLGWYETNDNPNLFMNPIIDKQAGTSGWLPTSNVVEECFTDFTTGTPYLRLARASYLSQVGGVTSVSNTFPVNSGDKLAGFLEAKSAPYDGNGWDGSTPIDGAYMTLGFQYLDYNDNLLSNSGESTVIPLDQNVWKKILTPGATVPVATNGTIQRARVVVRVYKNTNKDDWVSKNTGVLFKRAALFKGSDLNEIVGLPFVEGYKFRDILCGTIDINVNRAEYDVQTLTARIIDPNIDPASLTTIETGAQIRLSGLNSDGAWVRMYTGQVSNFTVDYDEKETVINVEARDIIQYLGNIPQKENYYGIDPYFRGKNFFAQNDGVATSQVPNGTYPIMFQNDNATMFDQVTTTRDSYRAYAWVDKNNSFQFYRKTVLEARPNDTLPISFSDVHSDADEHQCYAKDVDISYDPTKIINVLTIKRMEYTVIDGTTSTEEKTYGPYSDQTSVTQYGARQAEITVGNYSFGADPDAYGASILAAYKNTNIRVNRLTFPVRNQSDLDHATLLETYSKVYVNSAKTPGASGYYRITDIIHEITSDHYYVTVNLMRPDELPALSGGQPALSSTNIGYIGSTTSTTFDGQFYLSATQFNKAVNTDQVVDFSSADRYDPKNIQNSGATFIIPKTGLWQVSWGVRFEGIAMAGYINGAVVDADDYTGRRWAQQKVGSVVGTNSLNGSTSVRWQQGQKLRLLANAGGMGTYAITGSYGSTFLTLTWLQD